MSIIRQVATQIDDESTSASETLPEIITFADGTYAALWTVLGEGVEPENIIYRREFGTDGQVPTGDSDAHVLVSSNGNLHYPKFLDAITLENGNIFITYIASDHDGTPYNNAIYSALYDPNWNELSGPSLITDAYYTYPAYNTQPEIVSLSGGGFVTSWLGGTTLTSNGSSIANKLYVQAYDANGTKVVATTEIATGGTTTTDSAITALDDDKFVVVYARSGDVHFNIYQNTGTQLSLIANSDQAEANKNAEQLDVDVAGLAGGGFVATWKATDGDNYGIYQRVFDSNGNPIAFGNVTTNQDGLVNVNVTNGEQRDATVTALSSGGWVVAWRDLSTNPDTLKFRVYDADGQAFSEETTVSAVDGLPPPVNAEITALSGSSFVVTWRQDTRLYQQKFDLHGSEIFGTAISETLYGTSMDDTIHGYGGDDTIYGYQDGGAADADLSDIIDGGAGADKMYGGKGWDTFIVDNINDKVFELTGEGSDTVKSSVTYNLATTSGAGTNDIERLILTGSADNDGMGNALNNTIIGNSGNNALNGAAGDDRLIGGAGNDLYTLDSANDQVTEDADAGIDTIRTTFSVRLVDYVNIERIDLAGTSAISASGNEFNNRIAGNDAVNVLRGFQGNDTLIGEGGNDRLLGGAGNDNFVFKAGDGQDTIEDFTSGSDEIDVSTFLTLNTFNQIKNHQSVVGGDLHIDLHAFGTGGEELVVTGITNINQLTANDFIFHA